MPSRSARLTLPDPPPSVNQATTVGQVSGKNRKMNSAEYQVWLNTAQWHLNGQPGIIPAGYWSASISVPGVGTKADLDNLLKGILDALGAAGKTPNDRRLVDLRIRFYSGDAVQIAVQNEDIDTWSKIRGASISVVKKMKAAIQAIA